MDALYKTEEQFAKAIPNHIRLLYEYATLTIYKEWNRKNVWDNYDLENLISRITYYIEKQNVSTFLLKDYIIYLMMYKYRILQKQEIIVYSNESHRISLMTDNDINSIRKKYYYEKTKYEKENSNNK